MCGNLISNKSVLTLVQLLTKNRYFVLNISFENLKSRKIGNISFIHFLLWQTFPEFILTNDPNQEKVANTMQYFVLERQMSMNITSKRKKWLKNLSKVHSTNTITVDRTVGATANSDLTRFVVHPCPTALQLATVLEIKIKARSLGYKLN